LARDFWTIDAETTPFHNCGKIDCPKCHGQGRVPQSFIWGAYNGRTEEYVTFVAELSFSALCTDASIAEQVSRELARQIADFFRDKPTVVYAHNGGRFDYHYLRDEINSDEPVMMIAGRMSRFKIGEAEFRDSLNIFQQTRLKDFGGKLEIEYSKLEPEVRRAHQEEIEKYLRVDCVDLWNNLARYFRQYGRGLTQAGASMRIWSRMAKIEPPRQTVEQFRRYKPFYYGGRVECFRKGVKETKFQTVDANSMYPFAMLSKHPFSPAASVDTFLPPLNSDIDRCLIRLKCVSDGAFPYRTEQGELVFPNDGVRRTFNITGWEFNAAREFNAIHDIEFIDVHRFPLSIGFEEYITHFYEKRKLAKEVNDKAENIFCKLFMNSLYGKFGSNPGGAVTEEEYELTKEDDPGAGYHEYVIVTDDSMGKWQIDGFKDFKSWGARRLWVRPLPEIRHHYYNVATAASITGFARAHLFRASKQCRGLIYGDTDSLTAEDVSALKIGSELGQWKVELTGRRYAVAGKKNYALESSDTTLMDYHAFDSREEKTGHWKIACKGTRLTPQELLYVASGGDDLYKSDAMIIEKRGTLVYKPESPTYSISREIPRFIDRKIRCT
jgi:hypothetical protein